MAPFHTARAGPAAAGTDSLESDRLGGAITQTKQPSQQNGKCPRESVPVTLAGKMDPNGSGYIPENDAWWDVLTEPGTGRTDSKGRSRAVGRDPMTIPPDVLTAAGHPPRRTRSIVSALSVALDLDLGAEFGLVEYRDLRRYCVDCAGNYAEVRRCAVINCPFWPYRMGSNPHSPRRGRNPFVGVP